MSQKKIQYLCAKCDYPAQNVDEFMDPITMDFVNHCPMCRSKETKTQKIHNFRLVWDMINKMGIDRQLREIGDVYLQLQEYDASNTPTQLVSIDVPEDVQREFNVQIRNAQRVLTNADILEFLQQINVRIIIHCVISR